MAQTTLFSKLYHLSLTTSFHNPNVLVTISKGMLTAKLRSNKILQFLTVATK